MMKAKTTMLAPIDAVIECHTNIEIMKQWDTAMDNFKVFY